MASIAYITDQNMISYHRLNGNTEINFWRPSAGKKISDFKKGDMLFFLAKGTEKGRGREKGLIGYGKLKQTKTLSLKGMWNRYQERNGYPSFNQLSEAICKVSKDKKIPARLNCMELESVVFFQEPIYLSEFGIVISNKIESFFYLDREDPMITSKILQKADEFGVDMWTAMLQDDPAADFRNDAVFSAVVNAYEMIKENYYTVYENKRNAKYAISLMQHYPHSQFLPDSRSDFIIRSANELIVAIPLIVNSNAFQASFQYAIGHYLIYRSYLKSALETYEDVHLMMFFNQEISIDVKHILNDLHIQYQIMREIK
ncbi:hypothetical protein GSF08_01565 [Clostridiaceae bacterium DONG20-135]|uniref:Uncharacterized protein n=1 Tax=Copranaerobaculum intestinale TaxID=2692629 RepID=A0A6N8U345_9FIRM|nr:hypothetical protein [Copranaerobaculum intestinale]MXQ72632.1 hypothetical protein [Copranaerobaculum intestinale]